LGTSALLPVTLELDDDCSIIYFAIVIVASRRDFIKLSLCWTACRGGAINVFRCPVSTVRSSKCFRYSASLIRQKWTSTTEAVGLCTFTKLGQQFSVFLYDNIQLHKAEHNRRSSLESSFILYCYLPAVCIEKVHLVSPQLFMESTNALNYLTERANLNLMLHKAVGG